MSLKVQLVSPEQVLFEGEADMVVVRTLGGGDIAFLEHHAQFLGALDVWPAKVVLSDGNEMQFAVHGGFVEVSHNHVIILSDVAELPHEIDEARARAAKERAEEALRADPLDVSAQAALTRAETRLRVLEAPAGAATRAH